MAYPKSPSPADVAAARVARLATQNPNGAIDLVPITFAMVRENTIVTAIDHKPKRTTELQRLENIRTNPAVTVLVDHYDEEWARLWWVRARGIAQVVAEPGPEYIEPLILKYEQYRNRPPAGSAIVIDVTDLIGWSAGG